MNSSGAHFSQRDPEVVVWPSVCLEAWGAKAKIPHMFQKRVVCWPLPRKAARLKNHYFAENVWFSALVPGCDPERHGELLLQTNIMRYGFS